MEFDVQDKFITIVAMRGSGKSELVKYILQNYLHDFDQYFIFSGTMFSGFYEKMNIPKKHLFSECNEEWMKNLMSKMERVNQGKNKHSPDFKRCLLVMDDMLTNSRGSHDKKFAYLDMIAQKGRHLGLTLILISQYYTKISPTQRSNSDYLFIGRQNRASYELIESQLNNTSLDKKEFMDMLRKNTSDFNFLIMNQSTNTSDINSSFGRFKVPNVK